MRRSVRPHAPLISRVVVALTLTVVGAMPCVARAQERPAAPANAPPLPEAATEPQGFIAEPALIERAHLFADRHVAIGERGNGFYVESGNMMTGAGWMLAGPGYRRWLAGDSGFADASAAISWRVYMMAQARFELPKLARSRLS